MPRISTEQKALIAVMGVAVLTLLYIGISRQPTRQQQQQQQRSHPFADEELKEMLLKKEKLLLKTELFTVTARNLSLRRESVPMQVSMLAAQPRSHIVPKMPSAVLLAPLDQSASMWEQTGTLQLIAETGHRAFAVDLPGSGSTRIKGKLSHSSFIQAVLDALEIERPLLIFASSAGPFGFEFAFEDAPLVNERLSGMVALSPLGATSWSSEDFGYLTKIYTALVYGGKQDRPGSQSAKRMKQLHTAELMHEPTAGHLHFLERPDLTHRAVSEALKNLED